MTTHTPGPWIITTDFIGIYDENARPLAMLDSEASPDTSVEESLANATLMAAAPDMLKVLEDLETEWRKGRDIPHIEAILAAISKATV
jgi:hypothetical protein